jgi:hypothetical protein
VGGWSRSTGGVGTMKLGGRLRFNGVKSTYVLAKAKTWRGAGDALESYLEENVGAATQGRVVVGPWPPRRAFPKFESYQTALLSL